MAHLRNGKVARLLHDKGFGFIKPDDGGSDLFFHQSACGDDGFVDLVEGASVTFTDGYSQKGPRAEDVERV